MSELVARLTAKPHRLAFGQADKVRADRLAELRAAIDRKYVLLKFTETRGGTELGVPLDERACNLAEADFDQGQGKIQLEGELQLDYVPVRMIATVDLETLEGEGRLVVLTQREGARVS